MHGWNYGWVGKAVMVVLLRAPWYGVTMLTVHDFLFYSRTQPPKRRVLINCAPTRLLFVFVLGAIRGRGQGGTAAKLSRSQSARRGRSKKAGGGRRESQGSGRQGRGGGSGASVRGGAARGSGEGSVRGGAPRGGGAGGGAGQGKEGRRGEGPRGGWEEARGGRGRTREAA